MKKFFTMLTLITMFASCQEDYENPIEPTQKRVTISPTITRGAHSAIATRATELSFEQGDKIGVTIIKDDQSKHADNALMTYTDGAFIGNTSWYEGAATSKILAYYPYASTGMPTTFSVESDQTMGYGSSDLMGAVKLDVTPTKDAVDMIFKHLLAKIVVNVLQTDEEISSVTISNSLPTATINWDDLAVTVNQTATATDITAQSVTANSTYRAIIIPQTVALSIAVTTKQGETFTKKLSSATIESGGQYTVNVKIVDGQLKVSMTGDIENWTDEGEIGGEVIDPNPEGATAYVTKVLDYMPAVGQFTNKLPVYVDGDTQDDMNAKALKEINNSKKGGMITLGGFGGYVVVGFDHTIANIAGKRDFRVLGNAFYADTNPNPDAPLGGSCEPGIIMVSYDANNNGVADDEWYEIEGSAHKDPTKELWYSMAVANGNDVNLYRDYKITYYKPENEPAKEDWGTYIRWEDNKGNSGYKVKNQFHNQCYYPLWADNTISFKGTCLPQNGIDESGIGNYFVLYRFNYGYADNEINTKDEAAIDIDWAVNSKGQKVHLPGVDFIKIYTGVNQESGWLGECSTEISGVEDLHVLGISIDTRN
ncbi:MAG: fimbrillin family protein [Fermentimonas sp.]|nr:fimbrillin family protein [Fermentimonas sp.]